VAEKKLFIMLKKYTFIIRSPHEGRPKKKTKKKKKKKEGRYKRRIEIKPRLLLVTRGGWGVVRSRALFLTVQGTTNLHCNSLSPKLRFPQFVINTAHPNLET